uniref:50S ribosomal protein L31 n=1 Tax=Anthurium amnicola TaxID=1678845 RepID=A0A1D1ZJT7_9ARAE
MASLHLATSFLAKNLPSPLPPTANRLLSPGTTTSAGRWSCRKKDGVHPDYYEDARVYWNGELVMTTGGTQREYNVDVWSGIHPTFLGDRSALLVEDDQVEKFRKKFGHLGTKYMEIPNLKYGEIVLPTRKKSAPGKGGKKK